MVLVLPPNRCMQGQHLERQHVLGLIKHTIDNYHVGRAETFASLASALQLGKYITGDDFLHLIDYALTAPR